MIENLTTATPVEIDTELARLYDESFGLSMECSRRVDAVFYEANAKRVSHGRHREWNMTLDEAEAAVAVKASEANERPWERASAQQAIDALAATRALIAANRDEQSPLHAEFTRRGGWTRAFLVITEGSGGHVHSSMSCSTCFDTTRFSWLPSLSGHDETEIVTAAGSDACTICYPSAPVETAGPRTIFTKDEQAAQAEREAREVAKRERQAAKVAKGLTADGSEFVVTFTEPDARQSRYNAETRQHEYFTGDKVQRESFKTEKAAVMWVVQGMAWSGAEGRYEFQRPAWQQVVEAVAAKHGKTVEAVWAEVNAKVAAKVKRDS